MSDAITFNPSKEYIDALLCKVSYEYLKLGDDLDKLHNGKFSDAEITYLKNNYEIVDGMEASNGFDGTWFVRIDEDKNRTGEAIFAIAGTDPGLGGLFDYGDDYDICKKGMATEQFIEAYNYYMRMANPEGDIGYGKWIFTKKIFNFL